MKIVDLIPNVCTTFLLPPTFAYSHEILIQNEKWKRTSVTFPKWTRGARNDEVQLWSQGQYNVSLWNWLSSFQTWGKITPVPSTMLIPLDPHLRGPTHHTALDSFIIYVLTVIPDSAFTYTAI